MFGSHLVGMLMVGSRGWSAGMWLIGIFGGISLIDADLFYTSVLTALVYHVYSIVCRFIVPERADYDFSEFLVFKFCVYLFLEP